MPFLHSRRSSLSLSIALIVCALASVTAAGWPGPSAPGVNVVTPAPSGAGVAAALRSYALRRENARLDAGLDSIVRRLGLRAMAERGDLAVSLVDLTGGGARYAGVNDDRMMYAASLPKIAILLGAFDAMDRGQLTATPELEREMVDMIRYSSNAAASAVLSRVGFENVAAALSSDRYRLWNNREGGLWVGKAYGRGDYWRRDPIAQLSHGATARQAARFFVMLDRGMLVSPSASAEMKQILGDPGLHHKFVAGLDSRPGADIYRKSGSWREYHADAALVERDGVEYVAVGLVRDANGGRVLERLIVELDELVADAN